jgi:hypothetical protein
MAAAVPQAKQLVTGFEQWLDPRLSHVGFVVNKMALGSVSLNTSVSHVSSLCMIAI